MLGLNAFWLRHDLKSDNGGVSQHAWQVLSQGKISTVVDVEKLAALWNCWILQAEATKQATLPLVNKIVSVANLSLKEPLHMREGIVEYAKRVAYRLADVGSASVVLTEPGLPVVSPEVQPEPAAVDPDSPSLIPPPQLPTSVAANVNNSTSVHTQQAKRVRVSAAATVQPVSSASDRRKNATCAECNQANTLRIAHFSNGCQIKRKQRRSRDPWFLGSKSRITMPIVLLGSAFRDYSSAIRNLIFESS